MPFEERKVILENLSMLMKLLRLKMMTKVAVFNALEALKKYIQMMKLFFANGGDRNNKNIPEMSV